MLRYVNQFLLDIPCIERILNPSLPNFFFFGLERNITLRIYNKFIFVLLLEGHFVQIGNRNHYFFGKFFKLTFG